MGIILLGSLIFLPPSALFARTVSLPLKVRYDLLRVLALRNIFTGPDQQAVLQDQNNSCRSIRLSNPRFSGQDSRVRFEIRIDALVGTQMGDNCFGNLQWNGYLALSQVPFIDTKTWSLSFKTVDVTLYDADHRPLGTGGVVGQMVKGQVMAYLHQMTINLAPPVAEFKAFLLPLFSQAMRQDTLRMLDSMRPGPVRVTSRGLEMDILADVSEVYEARADVVQEPVNGEELNQLIQTWQTWDAFLVSLLNSLPEEQLTDADRKTLLDALLDIRYSFSRELADGTLEKGFVRRQFINTWNRISSVFVARLTGGSANSEAGYLAFVTASDALSILDNIGPTMGLEISRNGLIRLAKYMHLANAEKLAYEPAIDIKLRRVLGFGPLADIIDAPADEGQSEEDLTGVQKPSSRRYPGDAKPFFGGFLCAQAWAAEKQRVIPLAQLQKWLVTPKNMEAQTAKVIKLLERAAVLTQKAQKLPSGLAVFFRQTVMATAWQESCFRQFVVKKKKLTYLKSYNRSSVGLMQINERVWRGIYDLHQLRWNITYNARAGCDILHLYLRRYVLKQYGTALQQKKVAPEFLSQLAYALYNGGPSELKKFPRRFRSKTLYLSDKLYREKLGWVKARKWHHIRRCLGS